MPSNLAKPHKDKTLRPLTHSSLLEIFRIIVRAGANLAMWHRFGMVIWFLLLIVTGELFSIYGLMLGLIFAFYILLYYLNKWLDKFD